jgi:hypothetical protein
MSGKKYQVVKQFNEKVFVVNTEDPSHTGEWMTETELAMLNGELPAQPAITPEEMVELHKLLEEAADLM